LTFPMSQDHPSFLQVHYHY